MAVSWTKEQEQVIHLGNRNLLVSAAAGSGKTAVLVERILTMITQGESPLDIDRLLVVTFTRAAAQEMKERLLQALDKRLADDPDNEHLQRQTAFIHHAQINTIDGFCSYVIRNYFHMIGLDPGYRTADEGELKLLKADVVKEVLEAAYEEKSEAFHNLVEWYASGKSDDGIEELILQLYEYAMSHPWPKEWLRQCREIYQVQEGGLENQGWMKKLWEDVTQNLEEAKGTARRNLEMAKEPDGPYMYQDALESDYQLLDALCSAQDYETLADILCGRKFARLSAKKDANVSELKKEQVKAERESIKEILKDIQEQYFFGDSSTVKEVMRKCAPVIEALTNLTLAFIERFAEKKRKKNLLDFTDMEHLALLILVQQKDGVCIRTQAAQELAGQFAEILIDEYQDSNYVQEMLLSSVSRQEEGQNNIFMVGDVKQSIYRFRLACPDIFMEKYQTYSKDESSTQRIDLHKNFRSREEVLMGTNYVFRQIMSKSLGNISYDDDAALYPGALFPEGNDREFAVVETLLAERDDELLKDYSKKISERELEARMIASRIKSIVGHEMVLDKASNEYRPAAYRDCVILLRTVSGWADVFARVLGGQGIPTYVTSKTGYFSALEVATVLNYLHICDNPMQEIPFTAVMRSPIAGCSDRELALVKSSFPEDKIYDGCMKYMLEGSDEPLVNKLKRFWEIFAWIRERVPYTPIHELILYILNKTGYGTYVSAMPDGEQRNANVQMLVERARDFEKTSYRGLFNFVRYIEYLQKYNVDFGEVNISGEQEDTVRIMSIHKSKGLEFPVVFVAGLGKRFNLTDINARLVMHPDYGVGTDCMDPERRLKTPTLLKQVIRRQTLIENLGEEMRVLYVAMTRAKEKLILTGTVDHLERRIAACNRLSRRQEEILPYTTLIKARDYWSWLLPALARNRAMLPLYQKYGLSAEDTSWITAQSEAMKIQVISPQELLLEELDDSVQRQVQKIYYENWDSEQVYDEEMKQILHERFEFIYPYECQSGIPVKVSVSELKKSSSPAEGGEDLFFEPDVIPLIPRFMEQSEEVSGADRGTAYHRIMECLDLDKTGTAEEIKIQINQMEAERKISSQVRETVSSKDIFDFICSDLGVRMKNASQQGMLYKEQPFVISIPASEKDERFGDQDRIMVQGIIDVFFYEGSGIVLADYKTDQIRAGQEEVLVEKYKRQLEYYAKALEAATGKRVKEKVIYSFTLGKEVRVV